MADIVEQEQQDPNLDQSQTGGVGNPAPKAPPQVDPSIKDKADQEAAAKAAADKDAADKAKADEEAKAKEKADAPLDTAVWGDTGSEAGNDILKILQDAGVTPDDAKALLWDATQAGDLTKIDKAKLIEKVGSAQANIILRGAEQFIKEGDAKAQATVASLHESVGGKDNWDVIATWAKANVDADELGDIKDMIDAGGNKAKMAAKHLAELYNADDNNTELGKGGEALPGKKQTQAVEPLSARAYADAYDKLMREHRGEAPEHLRVALLKQRQAGKAQGI